MYVDRNLEQSVKESLAGFPVTALLGPRQCGKSTLARRILEEKKDIVYLDLERPSDLRKLNDPEMFFGANNKALICIDEIQNKPELFPVIRVMVDEERRPGRFLILGSASDDLLKQSSESLAGRIQYLELTPFQYSELAPQTAPNEMWMKGGFPGSVLANDNLSRQWLNSFIKTFLSRDISRLGFLIPADRLERFWRMASHYHGQTINASKIGQALGISNHTVMRYLTILEKTFMVRVLQPLHANMKKRLVKSPKFYIRDSGILHSLLEIETYNELLGNPVIGASWEGFCIEQICGALPGWHPYFYRTSNGEEIDLILEKGTVRLAFELKASSVPQVSKGFAGTIGTLEPHKIWVVAPIDDHYPAVAGAHVCGLAYLLKELECY